MDQLTYIRIDEFIDSVNVDELDIALDALLLDRYGQKLQKLGRIRRLFNNEITEEDYADNARIGEDADEQTTQRIKDECEAALKAWKAQYETPVPTDTHDNIDRENNPDAHAANNAAHVTIRKHRDKQNPSTLNQGRHNDQSLAKELFNANNTATDETNEPQNANNRQTNAPARAIKIMEVDIGQAN